MNHSLRAVLEKALTDPVSSRYEKQLDIMFTKLTVIPLQRAWSKMTETKKQAFSQNFPKLMKKRSCMDFKKLFILSNKRHSENGQCVDCYYMDKYRFDDV